MDTRAAAQLLVVQPGTVRQLAEEGLIGSQTGEGQPWEFSREEIETLLRYGRLLKATLREAAQYYRLWKIVLLLQKEPVEAQPEAELQGLQEKALALARELIGSATVTVVRATRNLVRQGCGGAGRVLQTVLS